MAILEWGLSGSEHASSAKGDVMYLECAVTEPF